MTLNEFINKEKDKLDYFRQYWYERRYQMPDYFPAEMSWGDWDEQLRVFYEEEN